MTDLGVAIKLLAGVALLASYGFLRFNFFPAYRRWRRRSESGRDWQNYKARLPRWVKSIELAFQFAFWAGLFFLFLFALLMLFMANRDFGAPSDNVFGIMVIASLFAALVPAMLLANALSWLIPPMRRANLAAFEGFETASFRNANLGLAKVGVVLTPLALAIGMAAAFG